MSALSNVAPGQLVSQTVPARSLSFADRNSMWDLFSRYYADVTRDRFEADLTAKDHVIVLRDLAHGTVQGFSTLTVFQSRALEQPFVAVFSGDTIVAPAYWGQTALQRAFLSYTLRVKARHLCTPVYWFLISKGYRTYLLLSRNFPEYWPRFDRPTPPWQALMIDQLARSKYPDAWIPERGILRFSECQGRLRESVAPVADHMLDQPDIRFFVEANPGYRQGDELCCIGLLGAGLAGKYLTKLARRALLLGEHPANGAADRRNRRDDQVPAVEARK